MKFRDDVRTLAQNTDDSVFGKPVEIKNEKGEVTQKANWDIVKNYGTIFGLHLHHPYQIIYFFVYEKNL